MSKTMQFGLGPNGILGSTVDVGTFSENFAQRLVELKELGLEKGDVRVIWPPITSKCIEVEITFLFDNSGWVNANMPTILKALYTIFKVMDGLNPAYNILRVRYEGEKGPRNLVEHRFNLLLPYDDESQGQQPLPPVDESMPEDPKVAPLYTFDDAFDQRSKLPPTCFGDVDED